jgi:uncharacterized RDD family membrane protein YckC
MIAERGAELSSSPAPGGDAGSPGEQQRSMEAWRREVASRVQQHRARRRKQADPNALELDFGADEPYSFAAHSLSEDCLREQDGTLPPPPERFAEITLKPEPKIIRFPRPLLTPQPAIEEVTLDELDLAGPAPETPRIFFQDPATGPGFQDPATGPVFQDPATEPAFQDPREAAAVGPWEAEADPPLAGTAAPAQQMELLPNFEDIRLEPESRRLDDELDVVPRPAPLSQRAVAGLVDVAIVFMAGGIFAITFLELAAEMPHSRLTAVCAMASGGVFWLVFQYMFLTFGRITPGMRLAQLELCTFEGKPATSFARQVRALASALSGFSAGLGYAWALVDEDRLGWHDRISQTCVRGSSQRSALSRSN